MLNRQGYEAAIAFFGGNAPCFNWACSNDAELYHPGHERTLLALSDPDKSVRDFLENGVVIYPDLIPDNPLGASRVVRYLLYKNNNYKPTIPGEYVLSFSKMYHSNPDGYLFKAFTDDNLNSNGSLSWWHRTMDLTYYGKGPNFIDCFRIPETLTLTRTWPDDKNQLGILLRHCRYFFSWDSLSQTNLDAVSCGAIPVMLHEKQATRDELAQSELGSYPDVRLVNFSDKDSVVLGGGVGGVDRQVRELLEKIQGYKESWPDRVRQFAVDVNRHFSK